MEAKVGENDQLFGSITTAQIVDAIKAQLGVEVDRKRIGRGATIKTVGKHPVEVNLYRDINAIVTVLVGVSEEEPEAEESEEDAQADEAAATETEAAAE